MRFELLAILSLLVAESAHADTTYFTLNAGACTVAPISITTTDDDVYITTNGRAFNIVVEPDSAGATTGVVIEAKSCTALDDSDTCDVFNIIDTDGDGIYDSNVLTGVPPQRGNQSVSHPNYVLLDVTTAPSGGPAHLSLCGLTS